MPKTGDLWKSGLWLFLTALAAYNWFSHNAIYGVETFDFTRSLWQSQHSLVVLKMVSIPVAAFEAVVQVILSPSIFVVSRLHESVALRDFVVAANAIGAYAILQWQNPPTQKLLENLTSSTASEFKELSKRLIAAGGLSHLQGSLAWLCDEIASSIEREGKLASISLSQHLLRLHLILSLGIKKRPEGSQAPSFEDLWKLAQAEGAKTDPAYRQLWELSLSLLDDLYLPTASAGDAAYGSLLVGTLGITKRSAESL
ncbi:MAG: hypothetical protein AAF481_07900 [Acidobacteriota bacterium]